MLHFLIRILSYLSALVTAASVIITTSTPLSTTVTVMLYVVIGLALLIFLWDAIDFIKSSPKKFIPQSQEINQFMNDWVSQGGRTAILSGDLSWAQNNVAVMNLLMKKAKSNELILYVRTINSTVQKLAEAGAEMHDYSKHSYNPKSRFTVIDYEKNGERVAIGFVEDGKHVVHKFDAKNPVIFALVTDLLKLLKASC